jgi:two-component system OmpR family sensor kinase
VKGFSRSLRFRLTLWYCASLTLVMLVFGCLMYGLVRHRLLVHHDGMLVEKSIQVQYVLQNQEDCHVLTAAQVETMDHLGQIILLHEFNGNHEIYYQSPEMKANPMAPRVDALGWQDSPIPKFTTLQRNGMNWRILSQPYQAKSGRRGVIRLMADLGEVQETLRHLRVAMLLLIPAGILCSALGGFWLSGRALAPVDRINRMAREIEASKLDQRLPHPGVDDEIGRLVDTLNRMIQRLEGSFHAMKQFTADASHELRNPLATMRNTIDVVRAQPRTVPELDAAMESLGEDVDRLRRIVEDLLLLARADNGRLTMEREPVALDGLVHGLAETYQAQARELGVTLEVDAPAPAVVDGDERWLYQLVGNLLDNALKFTPAGGAVRVAVLPGADGVLLTVQDSGPGLPEGSEDRIFERFYQADQSRVRAAKPGSGLGLAIAAWIVASHGGRITAANHPQGGALFTVALPNPSN